MEHTPEELAHLIGDCTWGEAKLMLAAPALLEALEELTPLNWSLNDPMRRKYAQARAAIEAAK